MSALPSPVAEPASLQPEPSLLETLLERVPENGAAAFAAHALVGECVDPRHPTLSGRVRVCLRTPAGAEVDQWLPVLQSVVVRKGDRVLVQQPANWPEPMVVGVVDGFAQRPMVWKPGPSVTVQPDEALQIVAANGTALAEMIQLDGKPVLRVLHADVQLELPGKLRIAAQALELEARQGPVQIRAADDVIVQGETIQLN